MPQRRFGTSRVRRRPEQRPTQRGASDSPDCRDDVNLFAPPELFRRAKIDRAQDHAGRIAFEFDVAEFACGAFLDAVAQPQELLLALGRRVRDEPSIWSIASVEMAQVTLAWSFFIVNSTTIRLKSYS